MADVVIRRATIDDLAVVQKLATELMVSHLPFDPSLERQWYTKGEGKKQLLTSIKGRTHVCLVAAVQNQVVGFVTGSLCRETWLAVKRAELVNLFVAESYRRHGVGNKLVAAFKTWSKQKGARRVKLYVNAHNKDAIPFYEKNGFRTRVLEVESEV
jgi:ribosomal protein S18 acetylase RimI-like enzyme